MKGCQATKLNDGIFASTLNRKTVSHTLKGVSRQATYSQGIKMPDRWTFAIGLLCLLIFSPMSAATSSLRVATFNVKNGMNGSLVDNNYQASPEAAIALRNKLMELECDIIGFQEVHDYPAVSSIATSLGHNLIASRTNIRWVYPTAVSSRHTIISERTFNTDGTVRMMTEAGIRLPSGDIIYVFSIHLTFERWKEVHQQVVADEVVRRAGSYPVLVVGDMNKGTKGLLRRSRGVLSTIYKSGIDAILGSAHFTIVGQGVNHGTLGFSDHPLLMADVAYTPAVPLQKSVHSVDGQLDPGVIWPVGSEILPDPRSNNGIIITSLPTAGTLLYKGRPVETGQQVLSEEAAQLTYQAAQVVGRDRFEFQAASENVPFILPREANVIIRDNVREVAYANYTHSEPPTDVGIGYWDLAVAQPGVSMYCPARSWNFSDQLPLQLHGVPFIRNSGDHDITWPDNRDYLSFRLTSPSRVYCALGHRANGIKRDLPDWNLQWQDLAICSWSEEYHFDIFYRDFPAGMVTLQGNGTGYQYRQQEKNMVIFVSAGVDLNPPVITDGPTVTPAMVSGTTASLRVTAHDPDEGEGDSLTYHWRSSGPGKPTISGSSPRETITFNAAGDYLISVTVTSSTNGSVSSSAIPVTVQATQSGLVISP